MKITLMLEDDEGDITATLGSLLEQIKANCDESEVFTTTTVEHESIDDPDPDLGSKLRSSVGIARRITDMRNHLDELNKYVAIKDASGFYKEWLTRAYQIINGFQS